MPAYLKDPRLVDPAWLRIRTLLTIHNLGYQGQFPKSALAEAGLDPGVFRPDGLEFFGQISYIKGGIAFADRLNTVSPTYAREIQTPEYGCMLEGVLQARAGRLTGILNGIDEEEWDPARDALLPARYDAKDLAGKAVTFFVPLFPVPFLSSSLR